MKPKQLIAAVVPALAMTVGAAAWAADQATQRQSMQTRSDASDPARGQSQPAVRQDVRISQLVGMDVRNARGESLGDIQDLVIDVDTAKVQYAVVGFGGFLGLGEKLFAFPLTAFEVSHASGPPIGVPGAIDNDGVRGDRGALGVDRPGYPGQIREDVNRGYGVGRTAADRGRTRDAFLVLNMDQSRLKDAPGFDRDRWPDWKDARVRSEIDRFAGINRSIGTVDANNELFRATRLLDSEVRDAQNRDIGDMEDVVVELRSGNVQYAVIEFDRSWNFNDKLVAVPIKALRRAGDGNDLILAADRSRLERAPAFGRNQWPDLNRGPYRNTLDSWLASWDSRLDRSSPAAGGAANDGAAGAAATGSTAVGSTAVGSTAVGSTAVGSAGR